jgi:hypothetical protein
MEREPNRNGPAGEKERAESTQAEQRPEKEQPAQSIGGAKDAGD